MAQTSVKAVLGVVRFSYLHVFEPYAFAETDKPKYSATILIPKSDTKLVEQVKKAIQDAYNVSVTERWGGKKPLLDKVTCLRDGDEPTDDGEDRGEAYHGHYFINTKSNDQPQVVDKHRNPIMSTEDFYSGCYGYISCAFSGFDNNGNKGISCYLNNLMKVKDGTPLGGAKSSAESDFAGIDIPEEEEDL